MYGFRFSHQSQGMEMDHFDPRNLTQHDSKKLNHLIYLPYLNYTQQYEYKFKIIEK